MGIPRSASDEQEEAGVQVPDMRLQMLSEQCKSFIENDRSWCSPVAGRAMSRGHGDLLDVTVGCMERIESFVLTTFGERCGLAPKRGADKDPLSERALFLSSIVSSIGTGQLLWPRGGLLDLGGGDRCGSGSSSACSTGSALVGGDISAEGNCQSNFPKAGVVSPDDTGSAL